MRICKRAEFVALGGSVAWSGCLGIGHLRNARERCGHARPQVELIEPGAAVKDANGCADPEIAMNAASPMWDAPASTTQCGVLETDNLLMLLPGPAGLHQEVVVSTARYGVSPRLEMRWGLPGRMMQSGGGSGRMAGTTDQWLGACFRFHDQGGWTPDLALDFALKVPTANPAKGFGTGYADQQLTLIASRDAGRNHVDFNVVGMIAGSSSGRAGAAQLGDSADPNLASPASGHHRGVWRGSTRNRGSLWRGDGGRCMGRSPLAGSQRRVYPGVHSRISARAMPFRIHLHAAARQGDTGGGTKVSLVWPLGSADWQLASSLCPNSVDAGRATLGFRRAAKESCCLSTLSRRT